MWMLFNNVKGTSSRTKEERPAWRETHPHPKPLARRPTQPTVSRELREQKDEARIKLTHKSESRVYSSLAKLPLPLFQITNWHALLFPHPGRLAPRPCKNYSSVTWKAEARKSACREQLRRQDGRHQIDSPYFYNPSPNTIISIPRQQTLSTNTHSSFHTHKYRTCRVMDQHGTHSPRIADAAAWNGHEGDACMGNDLCFCHLPQRGLQTSQNPQQSGFLPQEVHIVCIRTTY